MSEDQTVLVYLGQVARPSNCPVLDAPAFCTEIERLRADNERLKAKVDRLTWKDAGTIYAGIQRCRHCWQLEPNGHVYDCIAAEEGER